MVTSESSGQPVPRPHKDSVVSLREYDPNKGAGSEAILEAYIELRIKIETEKSFATDNVAQKIIVFLNNRSIKNNSVYQDSLSHDDCINIFKQIYLTTGLDPVDLLKDLARPEYFMWLENVDMYIKHLFDHCDPEQAYEYRKIFCKLYIQREIAGKEGMAGKLWGIKQQIACVPRIYQSDLYEADELRDLFVSIAEEYMASEFVNITAQEFVSQYILSALADDVSMSDENFLLFLKASMQWLTNSERLNVFTETCLNKSLSGNNVSIIAKTLLKPGQYAAAYRLAEASIIGDNILDGNFERSIAEKASALAFFAGIFGISSENPDHINRIMQVVDNAVQDHPGEIELKRAADLLSSFDKFPMNYDARIKVFKKVILLLDQYVTEQRDGMVFRTCPKPVGVEYIIRLSNSLFPDGMPAECIDDVFQMHLQQVIASLNYCLTTESDFEFRAYFKTIEQFARFIDPKESEKIAFDTLLDIVEGGLKQSEELGANLVAQFFHEKMFDHMPPAVMEDRKKSFMLKLVDAGVINRLHEEEQLYFFYHVRLYLDDYSLEEKQAVWAKLLNSIDDIEQVYTILDEYMLGRDDVYITPTFTARRINEKLCVYFNDQVIEGTHLPLIRQGKDYLTVEQFAELNSDPETRRVLRDLTRAGQIAVMDKRLG